MNRPKPGSQSGRILQLLESANGGKVSLLAILNLHISQYSARIFELRHKWGFNIENGSEPGHPERTWFRLAKPRSDSQVRQSMKPLQPYLFAEDRHKDIG